MPAAQMYRVVETKMTKNGQVQVDIGCTWKPERKAKDELRDMQKRQPSTWFSIQKQAAKG